MDQQGRGKRGERGDGLSKINKATTAFGKWWCRQLLRGFGTIPVVTEFGPNTEFHNTTKTDHEEEILKRPTTLDYYDHADVAKAQTFLPLNQAIHTLTDEEKIKLPVYVPVMFADVFVAMATQTTADDKTAQLKDATTTWAPKQMRLN